MTRQNSKVFSTFEKATGQAVGKGNGQISPEKALERIHAAENYVQALFTGKGLDGRPRQVENIPWSEATTTSDASIILPRIISNILKEPLEPVYFLSQIADEMIIQGRNPLSIEFPKVGALSAERVGEDGVYKHTAAVWGKETTSIKIEKWGLMTSISDELNENAIFPLLTLLARMCRNAVDRRIESLLFNTMDTVARPMFDNQSDDTAFHTSGLDTAQAANYSFSHFDLIDMMGRLVNNRYGVTDVLAHPMAWSVFALDPFLRATFFHSGTMGAQVWQTPPQVDQTVNIPFGVNFVPYYALSARPASQISSGPASALPNTLITDIFAIDRANALFLAHRGPADVDQREDWFKDGTTIKVRRYAGVAAKDGGNGMVVARRVRAVRNYEPLFTIRNTT